MPNKTVISPLEVYPSYDFTGLTVTNHLSTAMLTKPKEMASVLSYAFGYNENNVMTLLTGGIGKTEYSDNREFLWNLHVQGEEAIELIVDSPSISEPQAGKYGTIVLLPMAKKQFTVTDVLIADDTRTTVRVMSEPYQNGNAWYTPVQVVSNGFIDAVYLKAGARWSKEYSTVGEYSSKGGGTVYSTPSKMRNQMTTLRKTYNVTREAALAVMVIELSSPDGKKTKMWTKLSEWTNMSAWYRELDTNMLYSEYNKDSQGYVKLLDENQMPIYHGAGVLQQIAPANKRYYTKLTYELLNDFLLDLSYAATKWGGSTKFVALTGKMGLDAFDKAIKEYNAANNITVTNSGTFITGSGAELKLGGFFKTVEFMNNIEVILKEFPPYNDITRNRELHPISGRPLQSYRFTILNFGMKNGQSNIRKIAMDKSENVMWHVCGSTDPFGLTANGINTARSSGIDGYEVHFLSQFGIMVEDPLSCGELIYKIA